MLTIQIIVVTDINNMDISLLIALNNSLKEITAKPAFDLATDTKIALKTTAINVVNKDILEHTVP